MIPLPDYNQDEPTNVQNSQINIENTAESNKFDEEGLVLPKKVANPCVESNDKKNLHRELRFNQKAGVNVLNKKTELQKALEKHKDKVAERELQKEKEINPSPLQKAMDERAQKLEQMEKLEKEARELAQNGEKTEFQKVQAIFKSKLSGT